MNLKKATLFELALILTSAIAAVGADNSYTLGLQAYKKGDYAKASTCFETALKTTQNDPTLWYYDALCFHQLKNWPLATQRYKTLAVSFAQTEAGQRARDALKVLDPTFGKSTAPPTATASKGGNSSSASTATNPFGAAGTEDKELASLPNTAYFYFTKGQNGHMEVDLQVNGHPVKALFDTGASAFFYKDQLKAAGLDVNGAKAGKGARGWAGVKVDTTTMPAEIKLGTLTRKLEIVMEENTSAIGKNLIGQDFVRGYQYEIDDKGGRVDLKKNISIAEKKFDPLYDIPLQVVHQRDIVPIKINGRTISAFIDTGAARSIIDPATAKLAGIEESGEFMRMTGVGGSISMAVAYTTIRIGPMVLENFPLLIGGHAGTAIGQDIMEGWRCKVDREHNMLRFFH